MDGWTDGPMDGWTEGRTDGWTDRRLKIPPCVLQDIGPLGPLPKKDLWQAEIGIWKENPHGNTIEFQWA